MTAVEDIFWQNAPYKMYSVVTQQIETENNHQIQCLPKTGAHQNGNWKFFARKVIVCNLDYS